MSAFFIPAEKLKPGTVPLLLPTMPASDGPILLSPGVVAWNAAQWDAKTFSPAAGSPAANAGDDVKMNLISRPALVGDRLICRTQSIRMSASLIAGYSPGGAQCAGLNLPCGAYASGSQ